MRYFLIISVEWLLLSGNLCGNTGWPANDHFTDFKMNNDLIVMNAISDKTAESNDQQTEHEDDNKDALDPNLKIEIDSLSSQLQLKNTVPEAHILCRIGSIHYRNFNFNEGLRCAGEALEIGKSLKDTAVIIRAFRLFADNTYAMGQYEKSTEYLLEELIYHEKSNDRKKIAEVYCNVGVNFEERGLLERGMYYYLEALKIYEQVDDKEGIVATLSNLAYVYRSQGNNTEAIDYFRRASEIEQKYLPVKKEYYFMANIAEAYKNMGRIDTAMEHLTRADSILKDIEYPDDEDLLIWIDVAKLQADIYNELGNTGKAYNKYLEALSLSRKTGYPEKEGRVVTALGTMLMNTGDLVQARYYLEEGRRIAEETGSFYLKKDVYLALSDIAGKQKAYREAWEYQRLYSTASDSVINLESAAQLANMQVKYETEKKEDQIQLLTQENEIRALRLQKSENQKLYIALTALLLLLLTGLTFNRYRLKRKSAALLAAKNTELSILNATKDKFFAIIAHDLKNPVSAFHNIAGQIDRYFESLSADELKYYIRELSSTSSGLLTMLKNLLEWSKSQRGQINPLLTEVSPAAVIEKAVEETSNLSRASNISLVTKTSVNHLIHSDENILVTVLRNLLTNAIKFSPENSRVTIGSEFINGQLFFSVADQGIGISDEDMKKLFRIDVDTKTIGRSANKGAGLGLIICQEFLQKIGGKIWAESVAGKGSTFYISVPAKKTEQTAT